MPSCSRNSKADVYYNLASAYARLAKNADCQYMLQTSFQLRSINQFSCDRLLHDPDLEGMQGKAWFQTLLEGEVKGKKRCMPKELQGSN
jgi:hypothetical protein